MPFLLLCHLLQAFSLACGADLRCLGEVGSNDTLGGGVRLPIAGEVCERVQDPRLC